LQTTQIEQHIILCQCCQLKKLSVCATRVMSRVRCFEAKLNGCEADHPISRWFEVFLCGVALSSPDSSNTSRCKLRAIVLACWQCKFLHIQSIEFQILSNYVPPAHRSSSGLLLHFDFGSFCSLNYFEVEEAEWAVVVVSRIYPYSMVELETSQVLMVWYRSTNHQLISIWLWSIICLLQFFWVLLLSLTSALHKISTMHNLYSIKISIGGLDGWRRYYLLQPKLLPLNIQLKLNFHAPTSTTSSLPRKHNHTCPAPASSAATTRFLLKLLLIQRRIDIIRRCSWTIRPRQLKLC
jgi:hypothetical protein